MNNLDYLFNPKSIAIIGASKTLQKVGHEIIKNIVVQGYNGKIFPVNPNENEILGYHCFPSVNVIPDEVDLAIVVIPAQYTPKVVRECVQKKVKGIVIISSGFGEVGEEGKKLEEEISKSIKNTNVRILGPNVVGFKNTTNNLDATFVFGMPLKGPIALISQSGALCVAMVHHAVMEHIGLSKVIGVGNKIDIDDADLINYLNEDKDTKVVAMYIEGIKDGKKFLQSAKKCCEKPIVIIKAGRTEAGKLTAQSHTGAMAGEDRIYASVFKQSGILRAYGINELFDYARALAYQPLAKGNKLGIISNSGGANILLADNCPEYNLQVAKISEKTIEKLKKVLPSLVKARNPVDVVGDADFYRYEASTRALLEDENIDGVIVCCVQGTFVRPREFAGAILKIVKEKQEKPIIACWVGGNEIQEVISSLKEEKVPVYPSTTRAVRAFSALARYGKRCLL